MRRLTFEAEGPEEARRLALKWDIGIEGEATIKTETEPIPEAYNVETTRRLLGGISRKTIERDLAVGLLERVPETRRVLITRKSIEQRVNRR